MICWECPAKEYVLKIPCSDMRRLCDRTVMRLPTEISHIETVLLFFSPMEGVCLILVCRAKFSMLFKVHVSLHFCRIRQNLSPTLPSYGNWYWVFAASLSIMCAMTSHSTYWPFTVTPMLPQIFVWQKTEVYFPVLKQMKTPGWWTIPYIWPVD